MMPALCCRRGSLLSRYQCPSPRIPQQVRMWGEQVSNTWETRPPESTLAGPEGDALALHFELQSKQCLIIGEKASMGHGSISSREKSPVAAGSREHPLFVLLSASSGAWSCPNTKAAPGMLQARRRSILALALSHVVPFPEDTSG